MTGKKKKNGERVKGSLGSGVVSITDGHDSATKIQLMHFLNQKVVIGYRVK